MTAQINGTVLKHGVGQLRPAWEQRSTRYPPLSTYKWADTERALLNLAQVDASPFDDVALEYTNPHTGGPVMQSFTCWIQMLRPRRAYASPPTHRQRGLLGVRGCGATIINGVEFDWSRGDMFVVPSWAVHEHINWSGDERAILFSIQDTPLLQAVNKYREEACTENGGYQVVSGVFDPSR